MPESIRVPNPLRLYEPNVDERKLDCAHDSTCVSLAAAKNWAGFSCQGCDAYEPELQESVGPGREVALATGGRRLTGIGDDGGFLG